MQEQASREAEDARAGWLAFCQQEPLLQTEVEKNIRTQPAAVPRTRSSNTKRIIKIRWIKHWTNGCGIS